MDQTHLPDLNPNCVRTKTGIAIGCRYDPYALRLTHEDLFAMYLYDPRIKRLGLLDWLIREVLHLKI